MCILSDTSIMELVIHEKKYKYAKNWFTTRDWHSINGRILIYPFNSKNLGPFSYDLCVGEEIFILPSQRKIFMKNRKEVFMEPDDIFLVLTKEYIGLPRELGAFVKPRFSLVRQGILQSMTKIDPTWFGKIVVVISNHSRKRFRLRSGQAFCTLIVYRLDKPSSIVLNPRKVPALGKESISYFLKIGKNT